MSDNNKTLAGWLRQHGPATKQDFVDEGGFSENTHITRMSTRKAGLRILNPRRSAESSTNHNINTGHTKAVYYLPEHGKKDVIDKFFEANPGWKELPRRTISHKIPREFRDELHEWYGNQN